MRRNHSVAGYNDGCDERSVRSRKSRCLSVFTSEQNQLQVRLGGAVSVPSIFALLLLLGGYPDLLLAATRHRVRRGVHFLLELFFKGLVNLGCAGCFKGRRAEGSVSPLRPFSLG